MMPRIIFRVTLALHVPFILAQTTFSPTTSGPTPDPSPAPSSKPTTSSSPTTTFAPTGSTTSVDTPSPSVGIGAGTPTPGSPDFAGTPTLDSPDFAGTFSPVPPANPPGLGGDLFGGDILGGIIGTVLCQSSSKRVGSYGIDHNAALDSTSYNIENQSPVDIESYLAIIKDQAKSICDGEVACIASVDDFTEQALNYVAREGQITSTTERRGGRRKLTEVLPNEHDLSENVLGILERVLLHVSQDSEDQVISSLQALEREILDENMTETYLKEDEKEIVEAAISVAKASTSYWHKAFREDEQEGSYRRLQGNILDCALSGNSHFYMDTSDTDFSVDNPYQDQSSSTSSSSSSSSSKDGDRRNLRGDDQSHVTRNKLNNKKREMKNISSEGLNKNKRPHHLKQPYNKRSKSLKRNILGKPRKLKSKKKGSSHDYRGDDYTYQDDYTHQNGYRDECMNCGSWQACDRCYNSGNGNGNHNSQYNMNGGYNSYGGQVTNGGYNNNGGDYGYGSQTMNGGYNNGNNNNGGGYNNGNNNNGGGYNNGNNNNGGGGGYNNGMNNGQAQGGGYGGRYQDDFYWYPEIPNDKEENDDDLPLGIDDIVSSGSGSISEDNGNPSILAYIGNFLYNVAYVARADVVGVVVGVVIGRGCILPATASSFLFSALYAVCYRRPGRPKRT